MCYIWDNYIQLYDNVEDIFLMGVGNAYLGVKMLLISRCEFPLPLSLRPCPTEPTNVRLFL
jgi:histone deacetylase 6